MIFSAQTQSSQAGAQRPRLLTRLAQAGARRRAAVRARAWPACWSASASWWGLALAFDRPIGQVEVGGQFQRVRRADRGSGRAVPRRRISLGRSRHCAPRSKAFRGSIARASSAGRMACVFITEHVAVARWGEDGLRTRAASCSAHARHILRSCRSSSARPAPAQVAQLYLKTYPRLLASACVGRSSSMRGAWQLTLGNGAACASAGRTSRRASSASSRSPARWSRRASRT